MGIQAILNPILKHTVPKSKPLAILRFLYKTPTRIQKIKLPQTNPLKQRNLYPTNQRKTPRKRQANANILQRLTTPSPSNSRSNIRSMHRRQSFSKNQVLPAHILHKRPFQTKRRNPIQTKPLRHHTTRPRMDQFLQPRSFQKNTKQYRIRHSP